VLGIEATAGGAVQIENEAAQVGVQMRYRFLSILLVTACMPDESPAGCIEDRSELTVAFDTTSIGIATPSDTIRMQVELAEREDQRSYGLMDRCELAEDSGMLFLYPEPQDSSSGFWMYRTRIPLDIAFFNQEGRIVSILSMEPCQSPDPKWCTVYAPGHSYVGALEANYGFFAARGIRTGDKILVQQ
jgi:uncharacterized protein